MASNKTRFSVLFYTAIGIVVAGAVAQAVGLWFLIPWVSTLFR